MCWAPCHLRVSSLTSPATTMGPMVRDWMGAEAEALGLVVAWGWVVMGLERAACQQSKAWLVAKVLSLKVQPMVRAWGMVVQSQMAAPHPSSKPDAQPPSNPPWAMPACSTMPALVSISPTTGPMIPGWEGGSVGSHWGMASDRRLPYLMRLSHSCPQVQAMSGMYHHLLLTGWTMLAWRLISTSMQTTIPSYGWIHQVCRVCRVTPCLWILIQANGLKIKATRMVLLAVIIILGGAAIQVVIITVI